MGNVINLNDYIKEKNIVIAPNDNNYPNSVTENDLDDFELKYAKALQEYYPTYNK